MRFFGPENKFHTQNVISKNGQKGYMKYADNYSIHFLLLKITIFKPNYSNETTNL